MYIQNAHAFLWHIVYMYSFVFGENWPMQKFEQHADLRSYITLAAGHVPTPKTKSSMAATTYPPTSAWPPLCNEPADAQTHHTRWWSHDRFTRHGKQESDNRNNEGADAPWFFASHATRASSLAPWKNHGIYALSLFLSLSLYICKIWI